MSGRKRISKKAKQSTRQIKTVEDDEESDGKRKLDSTKNYDKMNEKCEHYWTKESSPSERINKKFAPKKYDVNDQQQLVERIESIDDHGILLPTLPLNGHHYPMESSQKLNDDVNSTLSVGDEMDSKSATIAATSGVPSPIDSVSTTTTDRLQPVAESNHNSPKQYDDFNSKNKRRKRFNTKKSKYVKKQKKILEDNTALHPIVKPEKKSAEPVIVENERSSDKSLHRVAVLISIRDKFTLHQDMCLCCGSIGKGIDNSLIACFQCGQSYHHYCVSAKLTRSVIVNGWRCLDCAVCEGCGKAGDEDRLLLCDECDISYHTYCLNPQLDKVPEGEWKCHRCVSCHDCGSNFPGINCQWTSNYTQCGPCASTSVCPKCNKKYVNDDIIVQCNNCDRWSHGSCEGIHNENDAKMYSDIDFICSLCDPNVFLCNKLVNYYIYEGNKVKNRKAGYEASDFDQFNPIRAGSVLSEDIPFIHLKSSNGNNSPSSGRLKKSTKSRFIVSKIVLTKNGITYMKKLEKKRKVAWGEENTSDTPTIKTFKAKVDKKKLIREKKLAAKLKHTNKAKKSNILDSNSYLINTKKSKRGYDNGLLKKRKKKKVIKKSMNDNDQTLSPILDDNFSIRYNDQINGEQGHNLPYHHYLQPQDHQHQNVAYLPNSFLEDSNDPNYPLLRPHHLPSIGSSGFSSKESTRGSDEFPHEIIDSILNNCGNIGEDILNGSIEVDDVFNILEDCSDTKESIQAKNINETNGVIAATTSHIQNFYDINYPHNLHHTELQTDATHSVSGLHNQMAKTSQIMKCQREEALGNKSTMASILYANLIYPNLKSEYPEITARIKVMERLWRKLEPSERAKYTSKAKENRKLMNTTSKSTNDRTAVKIEEVEDEGILIPQAPPISHPVISDRLPNSLIPKRDSPVNVTASWSRLSNIWAITANVKNEVSGTTTSVNSNQKSLQSGQYKLNGGHPELNGYLTPVPKPIVCHKAPVVTNTYQQQTITIPRTINSNTADNSNFTVSSASQRDQSVPVFNQYQQQIRPRNQSPVGIYKETVNQQNGYNQSMHIQQGMNPYRTPQPSGIRPMQQPWPQNQANTGNQLIPVNQPNTNGFYIRPAMNANNYQSNLRPGIVTYRYPAQAIPNNEIPVRPAWPSNNSQGVVPYHNVPSTTTNNSTPNRDNMVQVKQGFFATPLSHNQPPGPIRFPTQLPKQNMVMPVPNNMHAIGTDDTTPRNLPSTPNRTEAAMQPRFTFPPRVLPSPTNQRTLNSNNQWNQQISPAYNQSPTIRAWVPVPNQRSMELPQQFVPMAHVNPSNNVIIQNSPRMMMGNQILPPQNMNVMYPINNNRGNNTGMQATSPFSPTYPTVYVNSSTAGDHNNDGGMTSNKMKSKRNRSRKQGKESADSLASIDPTSVTDPITRAKIEALNKFSEQAKSTDLRQKVLVGAKEHLQSYQKENIKDPIVEEIAYSKTKKNNSLVDDLTAPFNEADLELPDNIMAPLPDDVTDGDENIETEHDNQAMNDSKKQHDGNSSPKKDNAIQENDCNETNDCQQVEHDDCIMDTAVEGLQLPEVSEPIMINLSESQGCSLILSEEKDFSTISHMSDSAHQDNELDSFVNKYEASNSILAEPNESQDCVLAIHELKETRTKTEDRNNVSTDGDECKGYQNSNDDVLNIMKREETEIKIEDASIQSPVDSTMQDCSKTTADFVQHDSSPEDIVDKVLINDDPLISDLPTSNRSSSTPPEVRSRIPSSLSSNISSELPILLPIDAIQGEKLAHGRSPRTSNPLQTQYDTEESIVTDISGSGENKLAFQPVLPKLKSNDGLTGANEIKTNIEDDFISSPQISDVEFPLEESDQATNTDEILSRAELKDEIRDSNQAMEIHDNSFDKQYEEGGTKSSTLGTLSKLNASRRRKSLRWKHWKQSFEKKPQADRNQSLSYKLYLQLKSTISPPEHICDKRCCEFCSEFGDGAPEYRGRLLNLDIDKWVHINCALWSCDVYETCDGALHMVQDAYAKGKKTNCFFCKKLGATIKCHQRNCNRYYHFYCAVESKCRFFADKTVYCSKHLESASCEIVLESFKISRLVFIKRDELMQISRVLKDQVDKGYILRVGSLIFQSLGQLMPRHLSGFHSSTAVYPPGYQVKRIFWSPNGDNTRCFYTCKITESFGAPKFSINVEHKDESHLIVEKDCPKDVWQESLKSIRQLRENNKRIKLFDDYITGEDLFGLLDPWILRLLESLPGIDGMKNYKIRYGRCPYLELPLAINPSGCARTELVVRSRFKRRHTLCTSTAISARAPAGGVFDTHQSYTKLFVHSKTAQYRKLKSEWRSNIYLGRSLIQGLGLFARKNIEKNTMVIEYIGAMIRNEVANKRERIYQKANHGIYMFRIDPDFVVDATEDGGLARYINHSCQPNCVAEVVTFDSEPRIIIISNRRIDKGEELTYDYKFEYEDDLNKIPCMCGAPNCRGWMN